MECDLLLRGLLLILVEPAQGYALPQVVPSDIGETSYQNVSRTMLACASLYAVPSSSAEAIV